MNESSELNGKILNLGNSPLSFDVARNVLVDTHSRHKSFEEVPYFQPIGGQAYLFQSRLPLCKLHAKFDPYKFLYLGKGFNKEFAILKRYYHLKHNKPELDKNLYSFQRHIYCLATDECDGDSSTLYLVHYFGNDYLLEDAQFRKGAILPPAMTKLPAIKYETNSLEWSSAPSETEEPYDPSTGDISGLDEPFISHPDHPANNNSNVMIAGCLSPGLSERVRPTAKKRKLVETSSPSSSHKRKSFVPEKSPEPVDSFQNLMNGIGSTDYLFAMNMAAQLQQFPKEIKARVKFQIATVFYEAELKTLSGNLDDD